jgi:hypothetical protein
VKFFKCFFALFNVFFHKFIPHFHLKCLENSLGSPMIPLKFHWLFNYILIDAFSVSPLVAPLRSASCSESTVQVNYWFDIVCSSVIPKVKAIPIHSAKALGEYRRYSFYSFSTSTLDGVSGQRHVWPHFSHGEKTPGTHCTGGWVDPRASLDTEARGKILSLLPGIKPQSPGRSSP